MAPTKHISGERETTTLETKLNYYALSGLVTTLENSKTLEKIRQNLKQKSRKIYIQFKIIGITESGPKISEPVKIVKNMRCKHKKSFEILKMPEKYVKNATKNPLKYPIIENGQNQEISKYRKTSQ